MQLYLTENPRTLYLITSKQEVREGRPHRALVFRAAEGTSELESQAVVQFLPQDQVDLTSAVKLTTRNVKGCLGLINIGNGMCAHTPCCLIHGHICFSWMELSCLDIFLVVITSSTDVGNTRPSSSVRETVAQIHEVGFYSLNSSTWDDLPATADNAPSPGYPDQADSVMRDPYASSGSTVPVFEHPCAPLTKIISAGTFYYAPESHWDLSSRLSLRLSRLRATGSFGDAGVYDERFVWNEYIVKSLLDFRERLDPQEREELDRSRFIVGHCVLRAAGLVIIGSALSCRSLQYKGMWGSSGYRCLCRPLADHRPLPLSPSFLVLVGSAPGPDSILEA